MIFVWCPPSNNTKKLSKLLGAHIHGNPPNPESRTERDHLQLFHLNRWLADDFSRTEFQVIWKDSCLKKLKHFTPNFVHKRRFERKTRVLTPSGRAILAAPGILGGTEPELQSEQMISRWFVYWVLLPASLQCLVAFRNHNSCHPGNSNHVETIILTTSVSVAGVFCIAFALKPSPLN